MQNIGLRLESSDGILFGVRGALLCAQLTERSYNTSMKIVGIQFDSVNLWYDSVIL